MKPRRFLFGTAAVISLGFTALFAFAYVDRYWIWRDCFNELGRCYDPVSEQVLIEQAGLVWLTMGIVSLFSFVLFVRAFKKK